ncbi:hydrocephalus-inducing protein homolog [Embiotoca jacksoni]|uniref:hydrocephalus-inducing protein homolog n=1 Tax=Embiotoca jacksoni TaxID=100190 RepID=UPI0037038921
MKAFQTQNRVSLPCNNKLVAKEDTSRRKVTPSAFTQEMLQSSSERQANAEVHLPRILEWIDMSKTTNRKLSLVDVDQPLFQPYPSELVFQNFTPAQTYKLPLMLLNNDKVSRHVKLKQQDSEFFQVGPDEAGSKVAPGMSATFTVLFTPVENKDYHHRLVCVTERERFEVPIRAIGPRAILDFRDQLHLPVCPVKASTERTHLVRNIGNSEAKFTLHTRRPFSVAPSSGTLDVGESMQVTVVFQPLTTGEHRQELLLHYHTGEDVYVGLHGSCEELDVRLETDCVFLKKTYISLVNAHTVSLGNDSDVPLRYRWTTWPGRHKEDLSRLRESSVLQQQEEEEEEEEEKEEEENDDPSAIRRSAGAVEEDRGRAATDRLLALPHSCMTVEPAEGEIWPNATAYFHIVFKPEEARLYQQTIYCDVTGCESRLPLTIQAEGLGPELLFNYNLMDMKNVFIGDTDRYEVQLSNRGLIDAPFRASSPDTTFGRCFSFSPEEGVVPSGACQIVEVTFHSRTLGTYSEDLLLTVTGQPRPLTLTFRGCVIGPTFHFNVSELNFGDVAFGFPQTSTCTLYNTSFVPMTFGLRVLGDGWGSPSVSSATQVSDVSRKNWRGHTAADLHPRPAEFTVSPAAGSLRAMSDVTIKVTLCSNTVRKYWLALVVDVKGVGEEVMTLPINARCVVPKIVVETPALDFQRCFLDHPYEQQVRLTNHSDLPACYGVLDQEYEENPSMLFGSFAPRGLILPMTSEEFPLLLMAKAVGQLHHTLRIAVFGSFQPSLEVVLSCVGQGPVVHVQSSQLSFGRIPVLTDVTRTLQLLNQSPIPAHFTTCMRHGRSFWRVEPSEGEVPPESQLELKVVAHLKDTLNFRDQLEVSVVDSQMHTVPLSAMGTGTTIVSDKPFGPKLDLGTYFSHGSCQYHFKLTNHGQRTHRMYWKIDGSPPSSKTCKGGSLPDQAFLPPISTPRPRDALTRGSPLSSGREKPVFSLSPSRVELFPGCSVDMLLAGSSDSTKLVRERLVCQGIIGRQGSQENIMSVDITCRFVAPVLSISSKQLNFCIKKVRGESVLPLYEKLVLKNVSSLSLSMELSLVEPFFLCEAPGDQSSTTTKSLVLGDRNQAELWVCFNPAFCQDWVSQTFDEFLEVRYLDHPQQDKMELHAEIHYPNLHFPSTTVDFGCVFNCTEARKVITVTNCSPLPVSYRWAFLDDWKHTDIRAPEMPEEEKAQTKERRSSSSLLPVGPMPSADEQSDVRVEEVFDILPMYGHLPPGDQQTITFSFYGHENISREVTAQCLVEDGPTYQIRLRGEASVISYSLDSTRLDFGLQLFHCVEEVEVNLRNTGKVGFKFSIKHLPGDEEEEADEESEGQMKALEEDWQHKDIEGGREVRPGWPVVIPTVGYVDAGTQQSLRVLFLPGVPEAFEKHLRLQVAFLPPRVITVSGVGVFPRIRLDLPRDLTEESYSDVLQQAAAAVEADRVGEELLNETSAAGGATLTYEELLHMEVERLLIKKNALAMSSSLLELGDSQGSSRKWHKLSKFLLPEYLLDLGFVIPGRVISHTVNVTNSGWIPVSFHANCRCLAGTGFTANFERVKNFPRGEAQAFTVKFDPQAANLKMDNVNVVMPIQVAGGPTVQVRLRAAVTMPAITVSVDTLQFDMVRCGMCQMKTVHLLNQESVPCQWSISEEVKSFKKVDKSMPLYECKKLPQEQRLPPAVFETLPCSGVLSPGERVNVHVKFSPTEGCSYTRMLLIHVAESSQQVIITARGQGEEPQLSFSSLDLHLGPCLPAYTETEAEVTVRNPCSFPVEFYSLELDTQYLKEEKILRLMPGYDDNNMLLLPPRTPGDSLPAELLDYYQDYCSQLKDHAELKADLDEGEAVRGHTQEGENKSKQSSETSTKRMKPVETFVSELAKEGRLGQLETTPVSRAIARHMGVDLSPESLAARNCRGIALIVYGAPLTATSSTAAALARHYGAACLSVDTVVTDVLLKGSSAVSLTAKQLYGRAAVEHAQRKAKDNAQAVKDSTEPAAPPEDPNSIPASLDANEGLSKSSEDSCNGNDFKAEITRVALCLGGDVSSLSSLLPEQVLADVLAERFQLSDCYRGVVIDGLESVYTQSVASVLQVVLRALNYHKHIYVVNLSDSYAALTARERAQREAEEALQKERVDREERWLEELDDEEYDALPEEKKKSITQRHTETLRQMKLKEFKQMARRREEKKQQEERLREEERRKCKKGSKKDTKEIRRKKSMTDGKQLLDMLNGHRTSSFNDSKELMTDTKEQQNSNEAINNKETDDSQKQSEDAKSLNAESPQPTDRVEKEKRAENAETKRLPDEKDLKKVKKGGEKDHKEVTGKKSNSRRESSADGRRTPLGNNSKDSPGDANDPRNLNEAVNKLFQSKESDASRKKTEEVKKAHTDSLQLADKMEGEMSAMDKLQSRFIQYMQSRAQVDHILQHWDRTHGLLLVPLPADETSAVSDCMLAEKHSPAGKRSKKHKTLSPPPNQIVVEMVHKAEIIPQIVLNATETDSASLLQGSVLPPLDQVLDDLDLETGGPPTPPPTTFSVVPFPKHREVPDVQQTCFTFLTPTGSDEQDEEKKDSEDDVPSSVLKEDSPVMASKSRKKVIIKETAVPKDRDKKGRDNQKFRRRMSTMPKRGSSSMSRLQSDFTDRDLHRTCVELRRRQSLTTFRWVVPAGGKVNLKIWFYSESAGIFEQAFNFELVGSWRRYQLVCRGISSYPSICRDYTTLFALSKKVPQLKDNLQKAYVIKPGYFEFGPLLCSKTRDRYKENKYPENTEKLLIQNNTGLEAEVHFTFQHDIQATTYLLDPPSMTLQPGEKQELTVWAYPTKVGQVKDSIICQIRDNPELVSIELSCWGVRPELELESKLLQFERILLHRRDSRSLTMRNKTALPVSWRLQGVEELGVEFSVTQDQGIIAPKSSFTLAVHFKARRPLFSKRILHLEVSDVEKILGTVHTENIQIIAEAYDIALDITPDGSLDFGTIRVFEEAKLTLKLKNLGKYEIAYKFKFERTDRSQPNLDFIFSVYPQSGSLMAHDKPAMVNIVCRPTAELSIKDQPILPCQVIEPKIGDGGETIVILAIRVSVQAVFSRCKITPACDINFGPLVCNCKKTQSFTIENCGAFDSSFIISRMITESEKVERAKMAPAGLKTRRESAFREMTIAQNRLTVGVFCVFPSSGNLQPGSQQTITVDCIADQLGYWNQGLLIDVSGRNPSDHPDGIPYRLLADICKLGIVLDMATIFEEHHMCHNSSQLLSEPFCDAEGVFILDENKFIFNKVLVGRTATARFKMSNNNNVPCVVSLAIRHMGAKTYRSTDIFDLSATTVNVPSQSHAFAVVTFTPQTMQLYSAMFEATLDIGSIRTTPTFRNKLLEVNLAGEGTLPSVCVLRPALRNSTGNPLLQFRRALVGRRRTLPLVLLNDGNVPAQVQIDLLDKHGVFTLKAAAENTCISVRSTRLDGTADSERPLVHRAFMTLIANQPVELEVGFCSDEPLSVKATVSLQVKDNHYDDTTVQVTGETYREVVSLDNISGSSWEADGEDVEEGNYEVLNFGDCHVDLPHQESFTMTNHSSSEALRFEWPAGGPHIVFSPQVGHLHAGCSKEVTVTFSSNQPLTLTHQPMRCEVCRVEFQQPLDQVSDWDDRQRTVRWLSSPTPAADAAQQPANNKVIKIEPEPSCSVVEGTQWDLDLRISVVCDYAKFRCGTDVIRFKDTALYQTRRHQLQIVNEGSVKVEFSWQVFMDPSSTDVTSPTSRPGSRSTGPLTGARPSSALASVASLLMADPELPPFRVEPGAGAVKPGATQDFSIRFFPMEVDQFQGRLLCSIPNLQDGDQAPCISVCGRSLLPHCHFDLEDSDYVSRNPLDPNTRVIHFNTVGFSAPSTRCFSVLNPTSKTYSFRWRREDTGGARFRCLTPSGNIPPGKKVEACFEYVPEQMETVESCWSFLIESLSLSIPFLCVGSIREPVVYLDRPHLDFGEMLVGRETEQTVDLVNGEEESIHFSVLPSSLLCEDQRSVLGLRPATGTVAPRDRLPLSVSFTPFSEGNMGFKLVLRVKKKSDPLTLIVKGECFAISASFHVEKADGCLKEIEPNHPDTLNFGKVGISEQASLNFLVSNLTRFILEVTFDLTGPRELLQHLEAELQSATVDVGKQLQSSLLFCPRNICNLQDVRLNVQVKHGPTFTCDVKGGAVAPSIDFSSTKVNFGKCFLFYPGTVPPCQTLVICNKGRRDISVQCQFINTDFLEIHFLPDVLAPGAVMEVLVTFRPREARRYHEKLVFILNSCVTEEVDVLGHGIEMKLEVKDPRMRKVKLGSLTLGQKVKKQVVLVNHCTLDLSFTLMLNTGTQLDLKDLSFSPAGELKLKSNGGSCDVEIQFSPRQHIPPFTAELQAEFSGSLHPLLTVQGCCQGAEVQLDQNHLSFGAVVQCCQPTKRIVMVNTGDIGARFRWKTERFPADLSVVPADGYICPGMEVPFEITFAPMELSNDVRYENLPCFVEGSSSPIMLTVTGSCITAATSKEVVYFVCPVRSSHTQSVHVLNPTSQRCSVRPVIEGDHWSTALFVTLDPNQNKTLEVTYRPLTMTADGKKHLGSIFLSFPDGAGTLYSLQGTADPPKVEDTIVHELPAKTQHSQLLPVHNWLSRPQRFCVLIETLKPDKPDATMSLGGLKYIDVPALSTRDYKMSFFTYREGQYNTKVTFRNEATGEYSFYLVSFSVTSSVVLSTVELLTAVRRMTSATVEVENPLSMPTNLSIECKCPEISTPAQHIVPGQSKGVLSFEYRPLRAGESTAQLILSNTDLGSFRYELLLRALPAPPEKTVHFSVTLGSSHSVLVQFTNYSRFKTDYTCKTDCPDFIVDKSVSASPGSQMGSEVSMEVCFEPHGLGEVRGQLSLSSTAGGEYVFPLHGVCLPPKAQGPFSIRTGISISIPFKNAFLQTTAFSFQVDNPCFTVKGADNIASKKSQNITVSFEAPAGGSPGPWFSKLTVCSRRSDGHSKPCSWVYYLKGYRPKSS